MPRTKKTTAVRIPKNFDTRYYGEEPTWINNPEPLKSDLIIAFNWYNYFYDHKSAAKLLINNYPVSNDKELDLIKKVATIKIPPNLGYMARMMYLGCNFSATQLEQFFDNIKKIIEIGKKEEEQEMLIREKTNVRILSVNDRMKEKMNSLLGEVEGEIDAFIDNGYKSTFSMYDWLQRNEVKAANHNHIKESFQPMLDEMIAAKNKENEQLVEGFAHIKIAQKNRLIKFLQSIIDDTSIWQNNNKKISKPRKKKNVTPNKQLNKLQYLKSFKELKLVSFSPDKIIGANELITYNVKYKKLTYYISASSDGFSIKGTTLQNFSEKSYTKRLKKPDELLTTLADCGKIALRKTINGINTKHSIAKGRINNNTILLKVFK
jgi:hypothetical protein